MNSLKEILERIFSETPGFDSKAKEQEIIDAWPRAVGERIARHCQAVKLLTKNVDEPTLLVAAHSSAWIHQLHYLESQILEKLAQELKEKRVARLKFKLETKLE